MTTNEAIETLVANYPDACFEQLRCAVDMAIKALSAERKGKWEVYAIGRYTCPYCNFYSHSKPNFCPNCKARMEGERK